MIVSDLWQLDSRQVDQISDMLRPGGEMMGRALLYLMTGAPQVGNFSVRNGTRCQAVSFLVYFRKIYAANMKDHILKKNKKVLSFSGSNSYIEKLSLLFSSWQNWFKANSGIAVGGSLYFICSQIYNHVYIILYYV